jgi:hypothetical protein
LFYLVWHQQGFVPVIGWDRGDVFNPDTIWTTGMLELDVKSLGDHEVFLVGILLVMCHSFATSVRGASWEWENCFIHLDVWYLSDLITARSDLWFLCDQHGDVYERVIRLVVMSHQYMVPGDLRFSTDIHH